MLQLSTINGALITVIDTGTGTFLFEISDGSTYQYDELSGVLICADTLESIQLPTVTESINFLVDLYGGIFNIVEV